MKKVILALAVAGVFVACDSKKKTDDVVAPVTGDTSNVAPPATNDTMKKDTGTAAVMPPVTAPEAAKGAMDKVEGVKAGAEKAVEGAKAGDATKAVEGAKEAVKAAKQ
jgi:hypothetical protein